MGGQSHTPLVDEWAVIGGTYFYSVAQITKVSDKQVRTRRHGDREAHHCPEEVLFSGTEKAARDLFSVLTGLEERKTKAAQQLAEQHRARVAAAIAYAVARKATGESAA